MQRNSTLLSEVNPLAKVYHSSNLSHLIEAMRRGLEEFKEKAPHRKDFIEATETGIEQMNELYLWIETVYSEAQEANRAAAHSYALAVKAEGERDNAVKELQTLKENI